MTTTVNRLRRRAWWLGALLVLLLTALGWELLHQPSPSTLRLTASVDNISIGYDFIPAPAGLCLRVRPVQHRRDGQSISAITLIGWDGKARWSMQAPTADLFPMYSREKVNHVCEQSTFTLDGKFVFVQANKWDFLTDVPLCVNPHPTRRSSAEHCAFLRMAVRWLCCSPRVECCVCRDGVMGFPSLRFVCTGHPGATTGERSIYTPRHRMTALSG